SRYAIRPRERARRGVPPCRGRQAPCRAAPACARARPADAVGGAVRGWLTLLEAMERVVELRVGLRPRAVGLPRQREDEVLIVIQRHGLRDRGVSRAANLDVRAVAV